MSEIDWTKDVQLASADGEKWYDFVVIYANRNHVYGHRAYENKEEACMWHYEDWEFRNKPKSVQAILKMFRSPKHGLVMKCYIKNDATTVASVRRWHEETEGQLLDVIEIDLHNIEGL